ncbi:MAG: 16S rRNA (cytidine(1402)-2'-O)-methyltransferase, partial [Bacteroidota bacterium]
MQAALTLVPTPIGNLEDITLRALRVLRETDIILAEDTRKTGILLKHYEIETSMWSYHAHNEHKQVEKLITEIESGKNFALVSDAGTPAISDPGFLLTRECLKAGIPVECLPGATAFVPALVKSGLPSDRFVFWGFLPQKKGRQTQLKLLAELEYTFILYESPHRIVKTLTQLCEYLGGDRIASVSRELTKIHEETQTGTFMDLIAYFGAKEKVKGEIVLVVSGK